ncbi:MAG: precorrin-2 dehydrogenase/sirohydrochlorin ferrochelatase family protein [Desulforhopalus sp.]
MALYPVNLNLTDRLCVVVGGGNVALRKTRSLSACGAEVRVISPEVVPELEVLARQGNIELFQREFVEGDLQGVFLVFAATGDRVVQDRIMKEAAKYNALVNNVNNPLLSHFHVPAHFRRGKMLVTVSTSGGSPALARKIRQQLEETFEPGYDAVVELLAMIRDEIVGRDDDFPAHGRLFRTLLDQGLVDQVLNQQWFELQILLLQELPENVNAVEVMKGFLEKFDPANGLK